MANVIGPYRVIIGTMVTMGEDIEMIAIVEALTGKVVDSRVVAMAKEVIIITVVERDMAEIDTMTCGLIGVSRGVVWRCSGAGMLVSIGTMRS